MKKRMLLTVVALCLLSLVGPTAGFAQVDSVLVKQVIKAYYTHIEKHEYKAAYSLWQGNGEGHPKSLVSFRKGFQQTAHTSVVLSEPIRLEGAAGSVYATVPVSVHAKLKNGKRQRFTGTYILRRANGPAKDNRTWHIYSANLKPVDSN